MTFVAVLHQERPNFTFEELDLLGREALPGNRGFGRRIYDATRQQ
jgi:hypothetical protein